MHTWKVEVSREAQAAALFRMLSDDSQVRMGLTCSQRTALAAREYALHAGQGKTAVDSAPTATSGQYVGHKFIGERGLFALYCRSLTLAARYAAEQGWWLNCWEWRTDHHAPAEPQVITLRLPGSSVSS